MAGVARGGGGGGAGVGEKPVMFAPQQRPAQSAATKDDHNSTTVDVPQMIYDPTPPGHSYSRGKLLGRVNNAHNHLFIFLFIYFNCFLALCRAGLRDVLR
jgi:hypothetical protein